MAFIGVVAWPISPWLNGKKYDIAITALGEKNPDSASGEVWIVESPRDIDLNALLRSRTTPLGWEQRDAELVSYQDQPSTISLRGVLNPEDRFLFRRHHWSGKVRIEVNGQSREYDLHSPAPTTPLSVELSDFTVGEQTILRPNWVFARWFAIWTLALTTLLLMWPSVLPRLAAFVTYRPEVIYRADIIYRPDIDGLRATAVVLVLLFHFGSSAVPGGFVGVDVFFVISGYLISLMLLEAQQEGRFSFLWFYERRIRRILPALLAVIAFCLVAGYALLIPGDYRQTARSGLYALFGASNVFFLDNTGYFDIVAEFMPLLHTWSLAVEEQFYLFWPIYLAMLSRLVQGNRNGLRIGIFCVIVLSFGLNLWQIETAPKVAFFLPHTRAWELAIGALLALLPPLGTASARRWVAEVLPVIGIALIIWAALTLSQRDSYPGFGAVYPVLGAALVTYSSGYVVLGARLLAAPPLVFLGKISYSLYLWHWPLIVFWRHYADTAVLTSVESTVIGACSVVVAWVSWRWIEQPFRSPNLRRRVTLRQAALAALAVGAAALGVLTTNGFPSRLSQSVQGLGDRQAMWAWTCPQTVSLGLVSYWSALRMESSCAVGATWQTAQTRAILWGDSNAEHLLPLLDIAGRKENVAIALVDPCPAILKRGGIVALLPDWRDYNDRCDQQRASVIRMLQQNADIKLVLLAAAWSNLQKLLHRESADPGSSEEDGLSLLRAGIDELLPQIQPGRRVVLVNEIPWIPRPDPANCAVARMGDLLRRRCEVDPDKTAWHFLDEDQRPAHDVLRSEAVSHPANVTVYSPEDYLCEAEQCLTTLGGEVLYRDGAHLRRDLNETILNLLVDKMHLSDMLQDAAAGTARK